MKKKAILILITAALLLLPSCSLMAERVEELEAKVSMLESENSALRKKLAPYTETKETASEPEPEPEEGSSVTEVLLGESFRCGEVMELTLSGVSWEEAIYPSGEEHLAHIADVEGEKFLCVRGLFTNNSNVSVDLRYTSDITFVIDGEYRQKGTVILENANQNSFNGIAKPLQTLGMVIYVSVSDELYEKCSSASVEMKLVNNIEELEYYYSEEFSTDDFILNINDLTKEIITNQR